MRRKQPNIDELVEKYVNDMEAEGATVIDMSYEQLVEEATSTIDWTDYVYEPNTPERMSGKNRLRKYKWKHGKRADTVDFGASFVTSFVVAAGLATVLMAAGNRIAKLFNKETRHCVTKFGTASKKCVAEAQIKRLTSELGLIQTKMIDACDESADPKWCARRLAKKSVDIKTLIKRLKKQHGIN